MVGAWSVSSSLTRAPIKTSIGSPITGGTDNEILYIDGSGNLAQSSNLIFDGTKVGIGTSPFYTLDVNGFIGNSNGSFFIQPGGGYVYLGSSNNPVFTQGGNGNTLDDGSGNYLSPGSITLGGGTVGLFPSSNPDAIGTTCRINCGYFQMDGYWPTLGFNAQYSSVVVGDTYIDHVTPSSGFRFIAPFGGSVMYWYGAVPGVYPNPFNPNCGLVLDTSIPAFEDNYGGWSLDLSGAGNASFNGTLTGNFIQPINNYLSADGSNGDTTTVTTSLLVGKTMTFKNGLLVSFA